MVNRNTIDGYFLANRRAHWIPVSTINNIFIILRVVYFQDKQLCHANTFCIAYLYTCSIYHTTTSNTYSIMLTYLFKGWMLKFSLFCFDHFSVVVEEASPKMKMEFIFFVYFTIT